MGVWRTGLRCSFYSNYTGYRIPVSYTHLYKKSQQIILYLPKGSSFDELNFDIGAADMSWKDFDSPCNRLIVDVGAGNFEDVYKRQDLWLLATII